jgi:hypothetical protein
MFKLGQLELLSRVPHELLGSDQRVWMTDELEKYCTMEDYWSTSNDGSIWCS